MVQIFGPTDVLAASIRGVRTNNVLRMLVLPPGGRAGFVGATLLDELVRHGLKPEAFDYILAGSAGSFTGVAFKSRQHEMTPDIYREMADKWWYFPTIKHPTFYDYLFALLRGELVNGIKLDVERAIECPVKLLFTFSDLFGKIHFSEMKQSSDDVFNQMRATSAVLPFGWGRSVDNRIMIDGAYAHGYCAFARLIKQILRENRDVRVEVLFIANRPRIEYQYSMESAVFRAWAVCTLFWSYPLLLETLAFESKVRSSERLFERYREKSRVRLVALFPSPDKQVSPAWVSKAYLDEVGARLRDSLRSQIAPLK